MSHLHLAPHLRRRYQTDDEPTMPELPSALSVSAPDHNRTGTLVINGDTNDLVRLIGKAIDDYPPEKPYSIAVEDVPVTVERLPHFPKEGDRLLDPGTARATIAATNEAPNGTTEGGWAKKHEHQTVSSRLRVSFPGITRIGY